MAYQSRRELDRERQRLEEERRKLEGGPTVGGVLKGTAKVAAGAGIVYVGFKNKDVLIHNVSKLVGRAGVTLSRQSDAIGYRGKINEVKSLNDAFQSTYGNLSPKGLISAIADRKNKNTNFENRIKTNNHLLKDQKLLSRLPKDVMQSKDQLGRMDYIKGIAQSETAKTVLSETLKKDSYKELFGDKVGDVEQMFLENPQLLTKDLTRGLKIKDGEVDQIPRSIVNLFKEHNMNDQKSTSLNISNLDRRGQAGFMKQMLDVQQEVQKSVTSQVLSYDKPGEGQDTIFAGYQRLFEYTEMAGLRKKHSPAGESFTDKAFSSQNFRPLTMGEASSSYVREDARTGALKIAGKDDTGARKIEDIFNPRVSPNDGAKQMGLASEYLERAVGVGFDINDVKADKFSNYIKINDKTGEILNTYGTEAILNDGRDYLQDNYQVPFIRWNPLDSTQRKYLQQQQHGLHSAIYQSGEVHAYASDFLSTRSDSNLRNKNSVGVLDRAYVQVGEEIFDSSIASQLVGKSPDDAFSYLENNLSQFKIADNQDILDVSYGRAKQHAETLSGRTNNLYEDSSRTGLGRNLWDTAWGGPQEEESNWSMIKRGLNKFESPTGPDNILHAHEMSLEDPELAGQYLQNINQKLTSTIEPLSREAGDALHEPIAEVINRRAKAMGGEVSPLDFDSDRGIWKAAELISNAGAPNPSGSPDSLQRIQNKLFYDIKNVYDYNKENPDSYFRGKTFLGDAGLVGDQIQNLFGETKIRQISKGDELRRIIEQYGISLYDSGMAKDTIENQVKSASVLNPKSILNEVDHLKSESISSYFADRSSKAETVQDLIRAQTEFQATINPGEASKVSFMDSMQNAINRAEPWHAAGFAPKEERLLKNTYTTPITKYKGPIRSLTDATSSRPTGAGLFENALHFGGEAVDYASQGFGWFGEANSRSIIPWNLGNNLDMRMQDLGLGLSNNLKQTPAQIMMNQFTRRIVLPYALYQQGKWANDVLFGGALDKGIAQTYANMRVDAAGFREASGINTLSETLNTLMPWNDQLAETPIGIGLNTLTFGGLYDTRNREEMEQYFQSGEDPIRKGRFWGVGSSGAYTGGRIDRYEPNFYRKVMSDYQYTDTMYGSPSEYFANNPIPTLSHPFSPIRHLFTDPYHWENKHALSRPYAATGGSHALQMIPVVGPGIDRIYSSIFKPQRINPRLASSHRAYQSQYSASIGQQYLNMNAGGIADFRPSGSASLLSDSYQVTYNDTQDRVQDEDGYIDEEYLQADDIRFEGEARGIRQGLTSGLGPIGQKTGLGRLNPFNLINPNRSSQESVEAILAYQNSIVANQTPGRAPYISDAGRTGTPTNPADLSQVQDPNAFFGRHGQIEGVADSLASFGGMMGFVTKTLSGFGISDDRVRYLETSENFMDYTKRFYDLDLGGFPGDISEIGRRYVDDDKRGNLYNPIRNTMPDFMPGSEYFIDFKHGDPYSKISSGEIRLPGAA